MLDEDVKTAIRAVAEDWRERHEAGGDCTEFAAEIIQILQPEINRGRIGRVEAVSLSIAAGNYADGSDTATFGVQLDQA